MVITSHGLLWLEAVTTTESKSSKPSVVNLERATNTAFMPESGGKGNGIAGSDGCNHRQSAS